MISPLITPGTVDVPLLERGLGHWAEDLASVRILSS